MKRVEKQEGLKMENIQYFAFTETSKETETNKRDIDMWKWRESREETQKQMQEKCCS